MEKRMRGIINCTNLCGDESTLASMVRIAGITILERQIRIMRQVGVKKIHILYKNSRKLLNLKKEIKKLPFKNVKIDFISSTNDGYIEIPAFDDDKNSNVLYFDGASIFDERLPEKFFSSKKPLVAMIPIDDLLADDVSRGLDITTEKKQYKFIGIATIPKKCFPLIKLKEVENIDKILVEMVVNNEDHPILDISLLSTYNYDLRRHQTFIWLNIKDKKDNHRAKKILLDNAQKSVLDWPAWFIHRPIEKWIVYRICEWPITPNQITLINIIVAFIATYFFATGQMIWGLIFAIATGIIDGLDGKQARVKIMMSKIGKLEEVSDRIYEYSWYLAMAYHLNSQGYGTIPYILFGILFVLHAADVFICALFKFKKGVQIDDAGQLERNFRWIGSRRNTNIFSLIPFFAFGLINEGLFFITIYYFMTVAFKIWRTLVHFFKKTADNKHE